MNPIISPFLAFSFFIRLFYILIRHFIGSFFLSHFHILHNHRHSRLLAKLHHRAWVSIIPVAKRDRPVEIRGVVVDSPSFFQIVFEYLFIGVPQMRPHGSEGDFNQRVGPPEKRHFLPVPLEDPEHVPHLFQHLFLVLQKGGQAGVIKDNLLKTTILFFDDPKPFLRNFHFFFSSVDRLVDLRRAKPQDLFLPVVCFLSSRRGRLRLLWQTLSVHPHRSGVYSLTGRWFYPHRGRPEGCRNAPCLPPHLCCPDRFRSK